MNEEDEQTFPDEERAQNIIQEAAWKAGCYTCRICLRDATL